MTTIAQKTPGNIVVRPIMLKYAATAAKVKAELITSKGNIISDITLKKFIRTNLRTERF